MSARGLLLPVPENALIPGIETPTANFWNEPIGGYQLALPPTTYYLDVGGKDSDEANGSATQPWRTIDYAMSRLKKYFDEYPTKYTIQMSSGDFPAGTITYKLVQLIGAAGALMAPSTIINGPLIFDLSGYTFQNNGLICGVQGLVLQGGVQFKGATQNISQNWTFTIDNCNVNDSLFVSSPNNALIDVGQGFPASSRFANGYPSGLTITYTDVSGGSSHARGIYSQAMNTYLQNVDVIIPTGGTLGALWWKDLTGGDNTNPGKLSIQNGAQLYRQKGWTGALTEGYINVNVDYTAAQGDLYVCSFGADGYGQPMISTDVGISFVPSSVAIGGSVNQWKLTQCFITTNAPALSPASWAAAGATGATLYDKGCSGSGFNQTGANITWLPQPSISTPGELLTGTWYRTTNQSVTTTGNPAFVSVAWTAAQTGSDIDTISQSTTTNFIVNRAGIYLLTFQLQLTSLNTGTFTDRTFRASIGLIRGAGNGSLFQNNVDWSDALPTGPSIQVSGIAKLQANDTLYFQGVQYQSGGTIGYQGVMAAPVDFDLNTQWSWTLLKAL